MLETVTLVSDIVANAVQRAVNLHRFHLLPALPPVRQGLRKWPVPEGSSESSHRTIPRRVQWGFSHSKTPKALPEHVSLYSFKIIVSHIQFSFLTVPTGCGILSVGECLKFFRGWERFPPPVPFAVFYLVFQAATSASWKVAYSVPLKYHTPPLPMMMKAISKPPFLPSCCCGQRDGFLFCRASFPLRLLFYHG